MSGFIKMHRRIVEWEWYRDIPVRVLFEHLLLRANYKDLRFRGCEIRRGSLAASRRSLAEETGLSEQQIRTALEKLRRTGEIETAAKGNFTLIKVMNYNRYQATGEDADGDSFVPGESDNTSFLPETLLKPKPNREVTAPQPQEKEGKKIINPPDISVRKTDISSPAGEATGRYFSRGRKKGSGKSGKKRRQCFVPPQPEEVARYCQERGNKVDAAKWFDYYTANGWRTGRVPMKDWRASVRFWERNQPPAGDVCGDCADPLAAAAEVRRRADNIGHKYGTEARKRFLRGLINNYGVD